MLVKFETDKEATDLYDQLRIKGIDASRSKEQIDAVRGSVAKRKRKKTLYVVNFDNTKLKSGDLSVIYNTYGLRPV
jgi:hypothetical protein